METITNLRDKLQKMNSNLIVRRQNISDAISDMVKLCMDSQAPVQSLVYQKEITSEETYEEQCLNTVCSTHGIKVQTFWGLTLFHR